MHTFTSLHFLRLNEVLRLKTTSAAEGVQLKRQYEEHATHISYVTAHQKVVHCSRSGHPKFIKQTHSFTQEKYFGKFCISGVEVGGVEPRARESARAPIRRTHTHGFRRWDTTEMENAKQNRNKNATTCIYTRKERQERGKKRVRCCMLTRCSGAGFPSRLGSSSVTDFMRSSTLIPLWTSPNTTCFPSKWATA